MFKNNERWNLTIIGWGAFVLSTILTLLISPNLYAILGYLTSAVVLTIANIIHVLYKKLKKKSL